MGSVGPQTVDAGRARWAPERLLFGGDVNPDQWSNDLMLADIELMQRANVNTATVGVFSWASIEPSPGEYRLEWLDRTMDRFHEAGIGVILATPTASPPPWFSREHPEALPVTVDGVRLMHGSRDTYNPAAPAYRQAARRITRVLAERYGPHPALRMWHLHNEYGTVSFGHEADSAFRDWLRARYPNLDDLNRRWNTTFWSQTYAEWDDIHAPQRTQYLPNPAQALDFRRFSSDALLQCLRDQLHIVRELAPAVPATTNFILPTWNHLDQWAFARELDVVSIDHYPDTTGTEADAQVAFASDLARSFAGGRPWLLMEQGTSLTYDASGAMLVKEPGVMRRHSLQYIARGSNGSLFFQWRAPVGGAEFFHSAMVPHAGADSRLFREIVALGDEMRALAEVAAPDDVQVVPARVAILWSADGWWAAETRGLPTTFDYLGLLRRVHAAVWRTGTVVDFVAADSELSGYDLVLIPSLLAASDAEAYRFIAYAEGGGHLGLWPMVGTTDEHLRVRQGGYSGAFAGAAGIRVEEQVPFAPGTHITLSDGSTAAGWGEVVRLRGAKVVAEYGANTHGVLEQHAPAITRNAAGAGVVHYFSTFLDDEALATHVARMLAEASVPYAHPDAGDGMEFVTRVGRDGSYLFAFNHSSTTRTVHARGISLPQRTPVTGPVEVEPGGVLLIRLNESSRHEGAGEMTTA
jgi:beta-galactosidase